MTTDRELLELAAKAAGIEIGWYETAAFVVTDNGPESWNPLMDDGDALGLVSNLDLDIERYDGNATIVSNEKLEKWTHEPDSDDRAAATRRAIVRAAAEIGRSAP